MEVFSQISDWLFDNESAISALAGLLAIMVILFMPARKLLQTLTNSPVETKAIQANPTTMADRPSLVVLPFDDLSNGTLPDSLVDGFTEDLTTMLAKMSGYQVTARNTAFTYKGQSSNVQDVGRALGVRYALEGSIRPVGDNARITAQLIETHGGSHLWADSFDVPVDTLYTAPEEVAKRVALPLTGELTRAEATLAAQSSDENRGAWEYYQQAKNTLMALGWNEQSFTKVTELARKAIKADPDFAPARAYLSLILAIGHWVKLVPDPQLAHDEALECAEKALELAPNSSEVLGFTGCAFSDLGYSQRGIPIIEKAIEIDPTNAQAYAALGAAKIVTGDLPSGIDQLKHAIELSPQDVSYAPWSTLLSFAFALQSDNDSSLEWARSACKSDARYFPAQLAYARALAEHGNSKDAQIALTEAKRQYPKLDKNYIRDFIGTWVTEQLESAGLHVDS